VHRKAVGCKLFLDALKLSSSEMAQLLEYSQAMESHLNGSEKGRSNVAEGDGEKSNNATFDLLNGLLSKFSMAAQTPEHFYISCVMQANGNLDHAAGEDENDRSRGQRFKKKPSSMPFIYPRSNHMPTAALPVCNHATCKKATVETTLLPRYGGPGVRHGDWCDGTSVPPWEAHLIIKLLFPGLLMTDLATQCRTVVLASGSLSPLQSVCAELNLQDSATSKSGRLQTTPKPLEANHVVDLPKQLLAVAIGNFPNGTPLTVNYNNYKNPEFFPRLGDAIASVIESIPRGGVLVFFPSYSVLNKCVKCWNSYDTLSSRHGGFENSEHFCPEIWDRLTQSKGKVIVESTGSQELFEQAREEYAEAIRSTGNCILFAVFRGQDE
jgi:Helicase C-terminal domain